MNIGENLIESLKNKELIEEGNFITTVKRSFMKMTPKMIKRDDDDKLPNLYSIGITIEEYENCYKTMKIPMSDELTQDAIQIIINVSDLIPYLHLYNQIEIRRQIDELVHKTK